MTKGKPSGMSDPNRDEHAGKGGSYQRDPVTGQRTLVERAGQPAPPVVETEPAPIPAADTQPAKSKGAGNA